MFIFVSICESRFEPYLCHEWKEARFCKPEACVYDMCVFIQVCEYHHTTPVDSDIIWWPVWKVPASTAGPGTPPLHTLLYQRNIRCDMILVYMIFVDYSFCVHCNIYRDPCPNNGERDDILSCNKEEEKNLSCTSCDFLFAATVWPGIRKF